MLNFPDFLGFFFLFLMMPKNTASLICGGSIVIGLGLEYYSGKCLLLISGKNATTEQNREESRKYEEALCVETMGQSAVIVDGLTALSDGQPEGFYNNLTCTQTWFVVAVSLDAVSGGTFQNITGYVSAPVTDQGEAERALEEWVSKAPHDAPFPCYLYHGKAFITFPTACPSCDLTCAQTLPDLQVMLYNLGPGYAETASILLGVGSAIAGAALAAFFILITGK